MSFYTIPYVQNNLNPDQFVHPTRHKQVICSFIEKNERRVNLITGSIASYFSEFASHEMLERLGIGLFKFYGATISTKMLGQVEMEGYSVDVYSIVVEDRHRQAIHILRRIFKAARCSDIQYSHLLQADRLF